MVSTRISPAFEERSPEYAPCYNMGVMPTNDVDNVEATKIYAKLKDELEERFLRILAQPDVVIPDEEIAEDGKFTEDQRATLQAVLESEMPTPDEIVEQAKVAEHNAGIQRKRDEKQARKKARRAVIGKNRRRRR